MIDEEELAEIREINRHLPFAEPIEQGITVAEYNARIADWWHNYV